LQGLENLLVNLDEPGEKQCDVKAWGGLAEKEKCDRADEYGTSFDTELARFAKLVEKFGGIRDERQAGGPLGDEVVIVGVEPLGHFHGGLLIAVASHGEILRERDGLLAETLRSCSDEDESIEDLIVEGEIVGGKDADACGLLQKPVIAAQLFCDSEEVGLGNIAFPEGFESELELAVFTHARKAKDGGFERGTASHIRFSLSRKNHPCAGCIGMPGRHDDVALSTVPIHESGRLKRIHGERPMRFHGGGGRPAFGLWAAYRIAASHLSERQCVGLRRCDFSFPLPLRDSAGFTPAFRLTKLRSFAPAQDKSTRRAFLQAHS
jgi:hypothetical protein